MGVIPLAVSAGDRVEMKKPHPCGGYEFEVLRTGSDIKVKCKSCGREMIIPRVKLEKSIKNVTRKEI